MTLTDDKETEARVIAHEKRINKGLTESLAKHPARCYEAHGNAVFCRYFENMKQWADAAEPLGQEGHTEMRGSDSDSWATGGDTFTDCLTMARGAGWTVVAPEIEAMSVAMENMIDAEVTAPAVRFEHAQAGGAVDIGAFMAGEVDNMIEIHFEPAPTRGKVVRIVVPISANGGIGQDVMRRRGVAITCLAEALIKAGYTLEVWAMESALQTRQVGSDKRERLAYAIKVQDAGEALDPLMIAFAVGHPGMLRKLAFCVEEHENKRTRNRFGFKRGGGYGGHSTAGVLDLPVHAQDGPSIVLDDLNYQTERMFDTDEHVAAWITEQVERVKSGAAIRTLEDDVDTSGEW